MKNIKFLDILQTVAIDTCWARGRDSPMPRENTIFCSMLVDLFPSIFTPWASLLKDMKGSFRENKAHDFALKLMPWKHASDMCFPESSRRPPTIDPAVGNRKPRFLIFTPEISSKTDCQCLWCETVWPIPDLKLLDDRLLSLTPVCIFEPADQGSRMLRTRLLDLNCWTKNSSSFR